MSSDADKTELQKLDEVIPLLSRISDLYLYTEGLLHEKIKDINKIKSELLSYRADIMEEYRKLDDWSEKDLQLAYDRGYLIQRKRLNRRYGWGTLRKPPVNKNLSYKYRVCKGTLTSNPNGSTSWRYKEITKDELYKNKEGI